MFEVVKYPASVLKATATPVVSFGVELRSLLDGMAAAMLAGNGVGLAAPQVGVTQRAIVISVGGTIAEMINPVITFASPERGVALEGCLSVPRVELLVSRAKVVFVKFNDASGKSLETRCSDALARVVQHEIDHLNGLTILDRTDRNSRRAAIAVLKKVTT